MIPFVGSNLIWAELRWSGFLQAGLQAWNTNVTNSWDLFPASMQQYTTGIMSIVFNEDYVSSWEIVSLLDVIF